MHWTIPTRGTYLSAFHLPSAYKFRSIFLPCRPAPTMGVWLLIHTRGCHLTRAHSSVSTRPGNIMKTLNPKPTTHNGVWIRYQWLTHTVLCVKGHQKASQNPHDKLVGVEEEEEEEGGQWEWHIDGSESTLQAGAGQMWRERGRGTWRERNPLMVEEDLEGNLLCTRQSQDNT